METLKNNRVAHNQRGHSDKIYVSCLRQLPTGKWQVLGKWGKRGCLSMQLQVKGEFDSLASAQVEKERLFLEKLRKGYIDIENDSYSGSVTVASVAQHLEDDPAVANITRTSPKKAKPVEEDDEERMAKAAANSTANKAAKEAVKNLPRTGSKLRVKCINNLGLEHLFEVGEEYNAVTIADREMLMVADMTGMDIEVFAERFEPVTK